ncbi:MAG: amidohydrolase family protein [Methanoregula sp.]|jgi:5-methylthioadenosine/S-adenosylhomocysteine deaminase|nr:amidohydrolase family protein [Methanoregula sp.]
MDEMFQKNYPLLITGVWVDGHGADIFIDEQGVIQAIGEDVRKQHKGEAEFIIDGDGAIALPGLVNTHTHAAMTLLRGYADDMVLQDWLSQKIWPLEAHLTGDDVYWGTRLACLEMIRTGTTAFNDMYFFMEDAARAVTGMGTRAVLCHGFIDLGNPEKREAECRATEHLVSHIKTLNNPRIRAAVGPHAPYTVSKEGLTWCAEFAAEHTIGIHIHVSETEKEVNDAVAQHKKRPVAVLDECGILTSRTVAAHCCWLDEAECRLFAKRGVHASHNPTSNMKLATHRAMPYPWLRAAGAHVTLGTDGCSSNNNLDMFGEMKAASLLQKFFWNDPTLLPAPEALHMATAAGARALGCGNGTLAAGEPADLILVSSSTACNVPMHNATSNIVYSCNGSAVETTICNGRVLMLEREVPHEKEILAGAQKAATHLVKRAMQS